MDDTHLHTSSPLEAGHPFSPKSKASTFPPSSPTHQNYLIPFRREQTHLRMPRLSSYKQATVSHKVTPLPEEKKPGGQSPKNLWVIFDRSINSSPARSLRVLRREPRPRYTRRGSDRMPISSVPCLLYQDTSPPVLRCDVCPQVDTPESQENPPGLPSRGPLPVTPCTKFAAPPPLP